MFALAPLSGVYYPVDVLPHWLQPVAWSLPSAYVFEGMRAVLFEGRFRLDLLAAGAGLNVAYVAFATGFFSISARSRGSAVCWCSRASRGVTAPTHRAPRCVPG